MYLNNVSESEFNSLNALAVLLASVFSTCDAPVFAS